MSTAPVTTAPAWTELSVGLRLPPFERTPTTVQLVRYAGAEDDYVIVPHGWHLACLSPGVIPRGGAARN